MTMDCLDFRRWLMRRRVASDNGALLIERAQHSRLTSRPSRVQQLKFAVGVFCQKYSGALWEEFQRACWNVYFRFGTAGSSEYIGSTVSTSSRQADPVARS
jgi:hypothetical protein